jgi:hypothetical protein
VVQSGARAGGRQRSGPEPERPSALSLPSLPPLKEYPAARFTAPWSGGGGIRLLWLSESCGESAPRADPPQARGWGGCVAGARGGVGGV